MSLILSSTEMIVAKNIQYLSLFIAIILTIIVTIVTFTTKLPKKKQCLIQQLNHVTFSYKKMITHEYSNQYFINYYLNVIILAINNDKCIFKKNNVQIKVGDFIKYIKFKTETIFDDDSNECNSYDDEYEDDY